MIRATDLRDYAIVPALERLTPYSEGMYSPAAVNLLLGTAAHESLGGHYLHQVNGPAQGIFQVEPETYADIMTNFVAYRPILASIVARWRTNDPDQPIYDLRFSCMLARLVYWRDSDPLPEPYDIPGLAATWRRVYNTYEGHGSTDGWIDNYLNVMDAAL